MHCSLTYKPLWKCVRTEGSRGHSVNHRHWTILWFFKQLAYFWFLYIKHIYDFALWKKGEYQSPLMWKDIKVLKIKTPDHHCFNLQVCVCVSSWHLNMWMGFYSTQNKNTKTQKQSGNSTNLVMFSTNLYLELNISNSKHIYLLKSMIETSFEKPVHFSKILTFSACQDLHNYFNGLFRYSPFLKRILN